MKQLQKIILLSLSVALSGCTEVVEFNVGTQNPIIVVDGEINTLAMAHRVELTYSTDVFNDDAAPPVKGANVTIQDDRYTHILTEIEPGIYETLDTVRGYESQDYKLSIEKDGNFYSAQETLKPVGDIDCAFLIAGDTSSLFLGDEYLILMSAQEPKGLGDYYLWNYYEDGILISDTVTEKWYGDDEFIDGSDFVGVLVVLIDTEKVDPYNKTMMLEMKSISEGYYDYLYGLQLETFRGSPFDGPPANPPSNMSEGAIGFFRATDVYRKDMCVVLDINTFVTTCDPGCQETALEIIEL